MKSPDKNAKIYLTFEVNKLDLLNNTFSDKLINIFHLINF